MEIIDLHCDTLLSCYLEGESLRSRKGHLNLEKMKEAGAAAQCFAIFVSTQEAAERYGISLSPMELVREVHAYYLEQIAANRDVAAPAWSAGDVGKNWREGRLSAILTIEDCVFLEGKIERVEEMARMGARMAALTWNYENSLGFPHSKEAEKSRLGLKPFGFEAVERMNELGIIVDVSHLSEGGFYDVAKHSKKPFAASHSCARALCDHSRNLTDEQLRVLGNAGGVAGVNFCSYFLTKDGEYSEIRRIAEHAVYMADKAGIEAVALGSDFDGIECGLEMEDYIGYPRLIAELQKHFSDDDVERICSRNFLRLLGDCETGYRPPA